MFEQTWMPYCLNMGIGAQAFWEMNIRKLRPFILAYNQRKEEKNYFEWLNGFYVYNAVSCALANAFNGKSSKVHNYLEEPIRITPLTEEEKLQKAEKEREKAIAFFKAMEMKFIAEEKRNGDN